MPLGFVVRLGNGQLGAGDVITGERTGFNTQTTLGTGSWTWSGLDTGGGTVTNQTVNGVYYLATDGSVYFVPNGANSVGTISTASATSAPAFDDRTFGTNGGNTLQGDGTSEVIYGGSGTGQNNTGADTINAGSGNDQVFSGDGADRVTGGGQDDTIQSGTGDDVVYGDNAATPATGSQTLNWIAQGNNGTNLAGGFTQDTGSMRVTVDFEQTGTGTAAATSNAAQFVGTQGFATNSSLQLTGNTGTSTTTSIVFDPEAGSGLSNEVSNVQFRLNDIDTQNWIDQITIRAWNAQGQLVTMTLTASGNDTVNSANGTITSGAGQDEPNQSNGSVLVSIPGPVHHIELVYTNGGTSNQFVWMTNMTFATLVPADGSDVIDAGAGSDLIYGGGAADSITGGADQDTLYGGDGNDTLNGGTGNDAVYGDGGNDTLNGEDGADTLFGGEGADSMTGGAGSDTLDGGNGNDVMSDVAGANTFYGGAGADTISGGADADTVFGGSDADSISGNDGADVLNGDAGNDILDGGGGNDILAGGADNDTLSGGDGADSLAGGAGDDAVLLGNGFGTDTLSGGETAESAGDTLDASAVTTAIMLDLSAIGPGNPEDGTLATGGNSATFSEIERVILGSGADSVIGSSGADSVSGGAGADRFDGGAGNDRLDMGIDSDADVLVLEDGDGRDTVLNFAPPTPNGDGTFTGRDLLDVSGLVDAQGDPVNIWDAVVGDDGFGNAVITFPNGESVTLIGVPPGDVDDPQALVALGIPASDGTVTGTAGDDLIDTGFGGDPDGDRVDASDNILAGRGPDDDVIRAGDGTDTVRSGAGNDNVAGQDGDDLLDGGAGDDSLSGGAGNDTLLGAAGSDTLSGGAGNDTLNGGTGADILAGDRGNDTLQAGQGDTAYGGDGDDVFTLDGLTGSGPITIVGGNDEQTIGDTLQLGNLARWSTLNITSTGPNGQSGTIVLDDGTLLTFSEIETVICFTPGTRIATPQGARPVETLAAGDMVVTRDHGLQPIRWIGRRTVPARGAFAPVRIRPGVVTGLERDLVVSPQHRMLFQGYRAELLFGESEVLVAATHLVDGRDVLREEGAAVTYLHILFDTHEIIFADGAATESFHPGETGLAALTDQARAELFALFPDLAAIPASYGRAARRSLRRHEALLIRR